MSSSSRSGGTSFGLPRSISASRERRPLPKPAPISPIDSESEYGGLAYADSTDYEDDDDESARRARGRRRDSPPAVPPLPESILRKQSMASTASSRIQFGSVSGRSGRSDRSLDREALRELERERQRDDRSGIRIGGPGGGGHSRDTSASSSYSSVSSAAGDAAQRLPLTRTRSNSSAIAQALGLSQTPPSEYSKLGGPGINNVSGRIGRSGSTSSHGSSRRDGLMRPGGGPGSQTGSSNGMEKVLDSFNSSVKGKERSFASGGPGSSLGSRHELYRTETSSSSQSKMGAMRSMSRERERGRADDDGILGRSNTVQGVQSPDVKPIKLPARSLTSPQADRDKSLDGGRRKERAVRKPKVCLRCSKSIEDGRWVSVDGGGVLCEKCWKSMYLPKVCLFVFDLPLARG